MNDLTDHFQLLLRLLDMFGRHACASFKSFEERAVRHRVKTLERMKLFCRKPVFAVLILLDLLKGHTPHLRERFLRVAVMLA